MKLRPGQDVAAYVQYTKKRKAWILAVVVEYVEESVRYRVRDKFPDQRKRDTWDVSLKHVIPFPLDLAITSLRKGEDVLCLWLEDGIWSSMFYKGTVVQNMALYDKDVQVKYKGDDSIYQVPRTKLVLKRSRLSQQRRPSVSSPSRNDSSADHNTPHVPSREHEERLRHSSGVKRSLDGYDADDSSSSTLAHSFSAPASSCRRSLSTSFDGTSSGEDSEGAKRMRLSKDEMDTVDDVAIHIANICARFKQKGRSSPESVLEKKLIKTLEYTGS